MTSVTNSGITNGYDWYQITGSRQDYANYYNHCREITLEISNTKNPAASQLPNFWSYNYRSFLNYTEQCLYGIQGVVTDSLTHEPLSAKIFVNNHDKDESYVMTDSRNGFYARPIKGGTYSVTYSAEGYISQTKTITIADHQKEICNVALRSLTNFSKQEEVTISPKVELTPVNGGMAYQISASETIRALEIINLSGQRIQTLRPNSNFCVFPVAGIAPGIYLVKVETEVGITVLKMQIQH
jgi:hypothetical protein